MHVPVRVHVHLHLHLHFACSCACACGARYCKSPTSHVRRYDLLVATFQWLLVGSARHFRCQGAGSSLSAGRCMSAFVTQPHLMSAWPRCAIDISCHVDMSAYHIVTKLHLLHDSLACTPCHSLPRDRTSNSLQVYARWCSELHRLFAKHAADTLPAEVAARGLTITRRSRL